MPVLENNEMEYYNDRHGSVDSGTGTPDRTERDLASDAQWKKIQQNTFTRWANEHLKHQNEFIYDLETDLSDGLLLIHLVQNLAHKQLGRYNKKTAFRSQKLENVAVVLQFLQEDEGIKLVNIDSSDIVDQRLKLILGLIWMLILHYSISRPFADDDNGVENGHVGNGTDPKETPKQRLMNWIHMKIPDSDVKNFTRDWDDGKKLGALVDSVAPGLCPDWPDWERQNALDNTKEAMDLADEWLGVPKLIEPHEMTDPNVDERSVMTYLAQYPKARLRDGAPLRSRSDPAKVIASGPGLAPAGVVQNQEAWFRIETFHAGRSPPEVKVVNPAGAVEPTEIIPEDERAISFTVNYIPRLEGHHSIHVFYAGQEIPASPYPVRVEPAQSIDLSKISVQGPGLEPGVLAGRKTEFQILTADAGAGEPSVVIVDPLGRKDSSSPEVTRNRLREDQWLCTYCPKTAGPHSVHVLYDGNPIPSSPFNVMVEPASDPRKVRAWGRGLQPTGVRVGDAARFKVNTNNAGKGKLDVRVVGPNGLVENLDEEDLELSGGIKEYTYRPRMPGRYTATLVFDGQPVGKSPFQVNVGEKWDSKITAYGPGLEGGMVNLPCDFTVDTNGEVGELGFSIEGPSQAKIQCRDNEDGTAEISYVPTEPGDYAIHILCNQEDIPNSPFMAEIRPYDERLWPSLVVCEGPGLQAEGLLAGEPTTFTVDTRKAGDGPVVISGMDPFLKSFPIETIENPSGFYKCHYEPSRTGRHVILMSFASISVPGSPYRVTVKEALDPEKVRVYGPGVEPGVKSQKPTHFVIDCKQAGPGEIEVALTNEKGSEVDIDVLDNHDGSFTVKYTAPKPGPYQVRVSFAGAEIPGSPIRLNVMPHLDVGGIRVEGLDARVFVDSTSEFVVNARAVSQVGGQRVQCFVHSPSDRLMEAPVLDNNDGTYTVTYTPFEEGAYHMDVTYDQIAVPGTPVAVIATTGSDPSRVKAYGPGLEAGYVGKPCQFTVETKGAGTGGLGLSIEGPTEARMHCVDNHDGTCGVEYTPLDPGQYEIAVKFAEQHIPGSPFRVPVQHPVDASKVMAFGPGLEPANCRAGVPLSFHVDATKSGKAPLDVQVKSEKGSLVHPVRQPEITGGDEGLYDIVYYAPPEGHWMTLTITYGGKDVPASPYQALVLPQIEPVKVYVSGKGVIPLGKVPASVPQTFSVDCRDAGAANLEILVVGPDGETIPVKVVDHGDMTYDVTYVPDDVGPYNVIVKYGGLELPKSPYNVQAIHTGDASKCYIMEGLRDIVLVNEEHYITVNTAEAGGEGFVTARITPVQKGLSPLDLDIEKNKDDTTTIYYTPRNLGPHLVRVMYGGRAVPQGEFQVMVDSTLPELVVDRASLSGAGSAVTDRAKQFPSDIPPVEFWNIQIPEGSIAENITAEVVMPSGKKDLPLIKENADGSVTIKYQPHQKGLHEMFIKHNGAHVQGSPYQFHVDSVKDGYVTAYGNGLIYGAAGEPANFTVAAHEAHGGGLSISVEGPAKADIQCHDNKDGTVSVNWMPPAPGEYKVFVKYAEKNIHGSPFTAKISGEGRKRSHISVGSTSEVSLKISEDVKGLSASIRSPSGIEEPCFIRKLDEGHLGISFTPREIGEHLVSVKKGGNLLPNAPFRIHVGESEVGNAEKVKVSGPGASQAMTQQTNEFTVDTKNAGFGGLSISIEGPSKCEIQCKDNKDGTCRIQYTPTEPGIYMLNVKFADHHVPGSPFTIRCQGQGVGNVSETYHTKRSPASVVSAGQDCELHLKIPGANALDIQAKLMEPNGAVEDIAISEISQELFVARFKPKELGLHTISIIHKGTHISGSPFQFTVGSIKDGGSHKVRAGGSGLVRGEVNIPAAFNIYCREAGAGNLGLAIEGPSKAEIDFKDHKDGNCYVVYKVAKPGDYTVSIKWDEKHIPDSPFRVFVSPSTGEARKLELASFPSFGHQLNKPVTFTVLTHGAKGSLDAKVRTPSGAEDDCFITPIDEGESYAVRFIPRESGNYFISVKLGGTPMQDSPFRLRVGGKEESDPAAVTAGGEGLRNVETGQKSEFIINTCNAGAGTLNVAVDGPSKVTLDAYEVDVGYKVRYTPLASGDYFVTIKYNGVHIPGSPYKVICSGKSIGGSGYNESSSVQINAVEKSGTGDMDAAPTLKGDPNKVTCKGMGLKKAYVGRQNMFTVDASNAGNDVLTVSMFTKDGPGDEVYIKHQGRGLYTINYVTRKRATTAYIYVQYGGRHIPGSPFVVET